MSWSPSQYLQFRGERARPAQDLLQAVPDLPVRRAADLGCGPANSTELIARRFPNAFVEGIDTSPAMIEEARRKLPQAHFTCEDIAAWRPPCPVDLIFANASLQWVMDHATLLPRLASYLGQTGCLAIQMPDNLEEPSHVAMRKVAAGMPFASKLAAAAARRTALGDAAWYFALLRPLFERVDIWRTTYHHPLQGGLAAIVEWVRGTALIPFLEPLNEGERAAYLDAYERELTLVYQPLADGIVLLPYPRLFIVAVKNA